jgi:ABC-type multidrug transport system fused ATPase/permease subunit
MQFNGRKQMKRIILFWLMLITLTISFLAIAGKKHCQSYRKKLDNIQAQQRQASSLKRSNSLSAREAKARDSWWRCETGKLKAKKEKKKKAKKKYSKKLKQKNITQQNAANRPKKSSKVLIPFASNRAVVVRAKYQGEQLKAWLTFYRPAKMCARPKSTQQFAACVEDKRRQQAAFESSY